jgi:regulator of telomere elongation helicase 1
VRSRTCYYYTNVEKKKDDPDFHSGVMDVEDLVAAGKKHAVCPYYLAKELQQSADITFSPYNYLLDAARTKKMGVEMAGAAVIIDEAHNIEQVP